MTQRPDHTAGGRTGERGFTLIELLIVIVIIGVLVTAAWVAMQGAKTSSRARAMTATTSSVAQAVSSFNRMRPPIGASDPITAGTSWSPTQTEATGGLYSITGERLLDPWPTNPYSGGPVTVRRQAACPSSVPIGQVTICRPGGASRATFRVLGGARDRSGNAYVVFDKTFS